MQSSQPDEPTDKLNLAKGSFDLGCSILNVRDIAELIYIGGHFIRLRLDDAKLNRRQFDMLERLYTDGAIGHWNADASKYVAVHENANMPAHGYVLLPVDRSEHIFNAFKQSGLSVTCNNKANISELFHHSARHFPVAFFDIHSGVKKLPVGGPDKEK